MQLTGVLSIGLLIAIAFLDLDVKGKVLNTSLIRKTRTLIYSWLAATVIYILIQIAYLLEQPFLASLDPTVIRSYLTQTSIGKSYLLQILGIGLLLLIPLKKVISTYVALLISLVAITAPVFQSHGSTSGYHALAIGALVVHVVALSFWVGGLFGLTQLSKGNKLLALPRFSEIALWSAIAVVLTGAATAWTRLDSIAAWQSKYGAVTLLKIFLAITLIGFGALHRRWIIKSDYPSVFRLITAEIFIMISTIFVGSWLSTINPPAREIVSSPGLLVAGIEMPEPPTLSRVLLAYDADGLMLGLLIFAVALYIKGVLILSRRGDKWPVGRTIAFALGISAIDFATSGGLGVYSRFAFSNHMLSHMVLRGIRGTFIALLHSKLSKLYTHPVVALAIFNGSLFALYFTPLFGNLMQGHSGHFFMSIHFLLSGVLFFQVLIGIDPMPRKVPHIVKMIIIFAAMSIHAFFSISVMSASTLLDNGYFALLERPWATDLLADQRSGGAIGWAMGEIPILLALLATFIQWTRQDKKEAARIDRAADRAAAMGEKDDLALYNQYLAELNRRDNSQ
jgi:cytochrome c oxidase assembly factor CtaG/putative copper export protein